MIHESKRHHRQSIRLKGYDYSGPGTYFVTICAQHRACLFGAIDQDGVKLNQVGTVIEWWWQDLPKRFPNVMRDAFVVMPNHVHGIVVIKPLDVVPSTVQFADEPGTHGGVPLPPAPRLPHLGEIIGWFKSVTTNDYIRGVATLGWPPFHHRLWQRNYYEQIIRDEAHLNRIRAYIANNPANWRYDDEHPERIS